MKYSFIGTIKILTISITNNNRKYLETIIYGKVGTEKNTCELIQKKEKEFSSTFGNLSFFIKKEN